MTMGDRDFADPPPPSGARISARHDGRAARLRAKLDLLEEAAMRYAYGPCLLTEADLRSAAIEYAHVAREPRRQTVQERSAKVTRQRRAAGNMGTR